MKSRFEEIVDEQESYTDDALYNITSYGVDMSFREIISMYVEGDIEKPELQRNYVWSKKEASRFIDSVLLGLPVPSIFLAKTPDSKLLIVDGYQRIMTVYDYMNGIFSGDNSIFKLTKAENIHPNWRGKAYVELTEAQKRSLKMYTIHAIVFEQKQPQNDTGMYQIFERINTGGRTLKPQEIRNCVYHGQYNTMLFDLNKNSDWRAIVGTQDEDSRMTDVELILRFFAFNSIRMSYDQQPKQINLVRFLNNYMAQQMGSTDADIFECTSSFAHVMKFLNATIGDNCFRTCKQKNGTVVWAKKVNPVVMDAVCTATVFALERLSEDTLAGIDMTAQYTALMVSPEFTSVTKSRTTDMSNIQKRVQLAASVLYGIDV
mgnify:CR=1 FL=1